MGPFQRGRHVQAFILLCLTDGEAYGLEIQERIDDLIPQNRMDRAFLYRTLNRLEKENCVTVRLDESHRGPIRKYYTLKSEGYSVLESFEKEIQFRVNNLTLFLDKYTRFKCGSNKEN